MEYIATLEGVFSNRKRLFWIGHSLFWLIIGGANFFMGPTSLESTTVAALSAVVTLAGMLATTPLRYLYRSVSLHRFNLALIIFCVLLASIAGAIVWTYVMIIADHFVADYSIELNPLLLLRPLYFNSFAVFLWSCLYLTYKLWEEWNDQRFTLEQERALVRTAQLETLKHQLNPHFLFNTLSSLRGLIDDDPAKARDLVTHISDFLRYSLVEGKNSEVQFSKEVEMVRQYLNIEQIRFNDDLVTVFDIAPETLDFMIPVLLIQPAVENAVKHGMHTSSLPLTVTVRSKMIGHALSIEIQNSGIWRENDTAHRSHGMGIGLQNIQKRLNHSFPDKHTFEIKKGPDYVSIRMTIAGR